MITLSIEALPEVISLDGDGSTAVLEEALRKKSGQLHLPAVCLPLLTLPKKDCEKENKRQCPSPKIICSLELI